MDEPGTKEVTEVPAALVSEERAEIVEDAAGYDPVGVAVNTLDDDIGVMLAVDEAKEEPDVKPSAVELVGTATEGAAARLLHISCAAGSTWSKVF